MPSWRCLNKNMKNIKEMAMKIEAMHQLLKRAKLLFLLRQCNTKYL